MIDRDVLHHRMLVYLYDPEDGHAEEIEETLFELQQAVDRIIEMMAEWSMASGQLLEGGIVSVQDLEKRLEIANADRIFYTDVWAKIKDSVNKVVRVKGPSPATVVNITGTHADMERVFDELRRRGVKLNGYG